MSAAAGITDGRMLLARFSEIAAKVSDDGGIDRLPEAELRIMLLAIVTLRDALADAIDRRVQATVPRQASLARIERCLRRIFDDGGPQNLSNDDSAFVIGSAMALLDMCCADAERRAPVAANVH